MLPFQVIRNLMAAHKHGRLDNQTECLDILNDITTALKNGCTRGRHISHSSKVRVRVCWAWAWGVGVGVGVGVAS